MKKQVSPSNPVNTGADRFLDSLRKDVEREKAQERENNQNILKKNSTNTLKYLDSAPPFIPGVEPLRKGLASDENLLWIQVPELNSQPNKSVDIRDDYGIFENNVVLVQGNLQGDSVHAHGVVTEIDGPTITVLVRSGTSSPRKVRQQLPVASDVSIGVTLNPIPYDRKIQALRRAKEHPIAQYLVGNQPVKFSHQRPLNTRKLDEELYKNQKQAEGIETALSAEQLACLQGPPGTGKTRVIIELIRRLAVADNTVLVAAETNAAVDNILVGTSTRQKTDEDSLLYHAKNGLEVARTNHTSEKVHPLARSQFFSSSGRAQIVASTHNSAADLRKDFDYVIIDEATQATIPSSLISITRGGTCILVGDHKQLPPFSFMQEGIQKSLFEHLYATDGVYGPDIGVQFDTQFRMREEIAGFSSETFYNGNLKTAPGAGELSREIDLKPLVIFDVEGPNERGDTAILNPLEAKFVEMQVKMLLDVKGLKGGQVGVAAAYRRQVQEIQNRLEQMDLFGVEEVKVDTFDSFQGSERTAMILSFTRSNTEGDIGFLGTEIGQRRLNVALTRAKRYCALVGDWDTLRAGSNLYEQLYQYVRERAPPKTIQL